MEPVDSVGDWVGLLGGLLVLAFIVFVVTAAAMQHRVGQLACGFDLTDPCNWSVVVVQNNTGSTVTLEPCTHHGGRGDHCGPPIVLRAWERSLTGQYDGITAATGGRTWVAVLSNGRRLGCLVLDGHTSKRDGDLVRVSQAEPCGNPSSPTTPPVGLIPSTRAVAGSVPTLRNAVALATVVAIDPEADVAEFRIKCGWYIKLVGKEGYVRPKSKVPIGLWKVPLRGLSFDFETYPNGPASGINHTETLKQWERSAQAQGWSGKVYLVVQPGPIAPEGFLTDIEGTDICAGVLG